MFFSSFFSCISFYINKEKDKEKAKRPVKYIRKIEIQPDQPERLKQCLACRAFFANLVKQWKCPLKTRMSTLFLLVK